jgi:hypothetical protein
MTTEKKTVGDICREMYADGISVAEIVRTIFPGTGMKYRNHVRRAVGTWVGGTMLNDIEVEHETKEPREDTELRAIDNLVQTDEYLWAQSVANQPGSEDFGVTWGDTREPGLHETRGLP